MEKKKNKKRRYRLFYLLLLLFITTITLSFSSYAWFTTNRLVKIDLLNVNVRAQGGIEISVDGTNWKSVLTVTDIEEARNNYPNSLNQVPSTLEPVSTVLDIENGKIKMFYGTAINNTSGNYILETVRSIEEESFGDTSSGKFIVFDLFFKTNQDTMLYLTPESNVTYSGESSVGIENSARIAFVDEGTTFTGASLNTIQALVTNNSDDVYLWEPNYDAHTNYGISNALNVYGITTTSPGTKLNYDGVAGEISKNLGITVDKANSNMYPAYFKRVDVDIASVSNFTNNVEAFNLRSGISKYRIYMWIEGQDVDCENNASVGNMALNLQFTTNPS